MELKILKDWKIYTGQEQDNPYDYISSNINPEDIYLIGKYIYFPDIIAHEKGFFLKEKISDELYNVWFNKLNGDIQEVEKVINHLHIYDLFGHFNEVIDEAIFLEIASQIKLSWEFYLKYKFPVKEFVIDFNKNDYGPTITFYCKRK
ncbi:hypothetical protein N0B16_00835 [Chryseobacterium sp. GMJ5]|uniref:Uncharacterized protein n=1 Tax=Chryseobacterium gilvum TaxID=2976534 RepID=A0ABT2VTQ0_9FLAO|nr:hypothetical protein [Chryseobacterium gilvum]MCU7612974.1 hypothetical protein [Chryseobacterium gilvum]